MKVSRKNRSVFITITTMLLLALTAGGCILPAPRLANDRPRDVPFVPPTLVPTALPTSAATRPPVQPANCTDRLSFLSDITIPDGTVVAPNASIDKRWEVENNGSCNWHDRYRLKLIAGEEMGAETEQALLPARSGTKGVIRMQLTAPGEPGTYRSAWQAVNPSGQPFGDPIYIEIVVQ